MFPGGTSGRHAVLDIYTQLLTLYEVFLEARRPAGTSSSALDPARMFAVLVASVALYLPATRLRCAPVRLQMQQPKDELKVGFSRGSDDGPKTSFAPANPNREKAPPKTVNEELMDEIQALMPAEKPAPKEAKPVDLNGIKPRDLLFGLPVVSAVLLVPRVAMAAWG